MCFIEAAKMLWWRRIIGEFLLSFRRKNALKFLISRLQFEIDLILNFEPSKKEIAILQMNFQDIIRSFSIILQKVPFQIDILLNLF